ncbi:26S proteasome non-ATPase regulatory subunit 13 [Phytophthora boehmeriae]|uniref:26S proteasome non-ATPase regulatory subunit 13 n=1 Tax=Phytophthora boehmeriae TaxID=109152 RepID=A0A8T1VER1_9STRA|nr:26S proteasome non-ATPase regulatory subunit 13 [Phytophthora boehmeriae]
MGPHDWSPGIAGAVTDKIWAQAIHSVADRQLTVRQAAQLYGVQHSALHRLVRQHTQQYLRTSPPPPPSFRPSGVAPILSISGDSPLTVTTTTTPTTNICNGDNDHYVFPRLNTLALGHGSPQDTTVLPAVSMVSPRPVITMVSPPGCELTPELNDEVVAVLRDQFMQQSDGDYEAADGRYSCSYRRLEGYADADITDVVRTIVSCNGRRPLASGFPSARWLAMFKRENDFVDMDGARSRRSRDNLTRSSLSPRLQRHQQQPRYEQRYELERQQQLELEELQRGGDELRWLRLQQNRSYRQPPAPPPSSPLQRSPIHRRSPYSWDAVSVERVGTGINSRLSPPAPANPPQPYPQARYPQLPHRERDGVKYRRSPSLASSNGHSDGNASDRSFRHSNMVPPEVWERAMEAVAIHGMSLRNAAKAHGVHFAALHRRLKKRQQRKLNLPCEPNYIPFEDEAGVVRVIHARADMGVQLTFAELVDLLKRTALKYRSELPEDIATALVRKFQSRVERSVHHLIVDWPSLTPTNVLCHLRGSSGGNGNGSKDALVTGNVPAGNPAGLSRDDSVPSTASTASGDPGSVSSSSESSESSSSLSPHPSRPQRTDTFPVPPKSRTTATALEGTSSSDTTNAVDVGSSNSGSNSGSNTELTASMEASNGNKTTAPTHPFTIRL